MLRFLSHWQRGMLQLLQIAMGSTVTVQGSFLQSPASVGIWQPWWDMFSPPFSMPFYRETREQLLLVGSFEFQEIRRSLFWSETQYCLLDSIGDSALFGLW